MKNTIIMWAMLVLLSFLTACGGSDSSGSFGSSTTNSEDADGDDDGDPDIVDDDNSDVALGNGTGSDFEEGVAVTALDGGTLEASASTTVTVTLVDKNDNNAEFAGTREVTFTSTCVTQGLAEFSPETITASGEASSTYSDLGCGKEFGAEDEVLVYIADSDAAARVNINVLPATVNGLQFISANPSSISLKGYGTENRPSYSVVTFQVLDTSGNPMPDRTVRFSLNAARGGASLSLDSSITDQDGFVSINLNAGLAAGTLNVRAEVDVKDDDGLVIGTEYSNSTPIVMATSFGDQDSFSLSADVLNPNAWSVDGESVTLNVQVGDHNQNPVIDGTQVYFKASGGLIESNCETANGSCSVDWISSNPRPVDGYVTIMAYTLGQGDFQDANNNGLFDADESSAELFTTYGESYVDANGSGTYDQGAAYQPNVDIDGDGTDDFGWDPTHYRVFVDASGTPVEGGEDVNLYEEPIDTNANGQLDETPASKYQGVNCSDSAIALDHCAEQINLVGSVRIQMSQGNNAYIEGPFLWDSALGRYDTDNTLTCIDASYYAGSQTIAWRLSDSEDRRNHLPAGTGISLDTDDVEVLASSGEGEVISMGPVSTDPLRDGAVLTAAEKYDYLNARGHLIEASIIRVEDISNTTGLGSIALEVDTESGVKITGGYLNVDLLGFDVSLFENNFPRTEVDVSGGTKTYTVKVKNTCGEGLPEDAVLLISLENGTLDSIAVSGGADSVLASDASSASVSIADSSQTTIITLQISSDGVSDTTVNGLDLSYYVPSGSDFTTYNLDDFNVID